MTECPTYGFAVAIVRNQEGKYLAVKEAHNLGWWLPAGGVDAGETFEEAAIRETIEEAGVKVKLQGVLRVERSVHRDYARMRVIFYAVPDPPVQTPKSIPDEESEYAQWVTMEEYLKIGRLRGHELVEWSNYLEQGGLVYPLSVLTHESARVAVAAPPFSVVDSRGASQQGGTTGQDNFEAFMDCVPKGDQRMAASILKKGFDVHRRGFKRWSALHVAVRFDMEELVDTLLQMGADVSATTHVGRSVLHFAANSTPSIFQKVLKHGGKGCLLLQDFEGETVYHWAGNQGGKILKALIEFDPQMYQIGKTIPNYKGVLPKA